MDVRSTARWTLLAPLLGIMLYYALVNLSYSIVPGPGAGEVGLDILLMFFAFAWMASGLPLAVWVGWRPVQRRPWAAGGLIALGAGAAVAGTLFLTAADASSPVAWAAGAVLWGWAVAQWWLAAAALRTEGRVPEGVQPG